MSAFGGKADIAIDGKCSLMTLSGHWGRKVVAFKHCIRRGPHGGKCNDASSSAFSAVHWPRRQALPGASQARKFRLLPTFGMLVVRKKSRRITRLYSKAFPNLATSMVATFGCCIDFRRSTGTFQEHGRRA